MTQLDLFAEADRGIAEHMAAWVARDWAIQNEDGSVTLWLEYGEQPMTELAKWAMESDDEDDAVTFVRHRPSRRPGRARRSSAGKS
jgi:hypothetical protein